MIFRTNCPQFWVNFDKVLKSLILGNFFIDNGQRFLKPSGHPENIILTIVFMISVCTMIY